MNDSQFSKCARYRATAQDIAAEADRVRAELERRVIAAEAAVAAMRAGLIDPDAAILLDLSGVSLNAAGELEGIAEAIVLLKQSKPFIWRHE